MRRGMPPPRVRGGLPSESEPMRIKSKVLNAREGEATCRTMRVTRSVLGLGRGLGRGAGMGMGHGAGGLGAPMARLLANLIVMASGMIGPMGREFMKAYNAALQSACASSLFLLVLGASVVTLPHANAAMPPLPSC